MVRSLVDQNRRPLVDGAADGDLLMIKVGGGRSAEAVMDALANNPNVVYSRDELLHNIWGSDVFVLARTVDVHIRKVREKIGEEYITTVKGVGYKFEIG